MFNLYVYVLVQLICRKQVNVAFYYKIYLFIYLDQN